MSAAPAPTMPGRAWSEVFPVFLYLGLTSFGGPVAHLGYFRREFVDKRRWLDDDLLRRHRRRSASSFLVPPAARSEYRSASCARDIAGAFAAWLGFTVPSAILMIAFGYGAAAFARCRRQRVAARTADRRGRRRRPGRHRHGSRPLSRPSARRDGVRCCRAHARRAIGRGADCRDRCGRTHRLGLAQAGKASRRHAVVSRRAHDVGRMPHSLRRSSRAVAGRSTPFRKSGRRAHRQLLSRGRACLRWRPCRAAAVAGLGRSAGLGEQRRFPRGLRRRAGCSRSALHIFRLSRDREALCRPMAGSAALSASSRSSCRRSCSSSVRCRCGTNCGRSHGRSRRCPESTQPSSDLLLAALYDPVWTSAIFTFADFAIALAAFVALIVRTPPILVVLATAGLAELVA